MKLYLLSFVLCSAFSAATVDRLAITVGTTAITELQIDEELRITALLNGQPVAREDASRRDAADRLVEQLLIAHEIEISRYPPPSDEEVAAWFASVEQTLGGAERQNELLREYNLTLPTLHSHLLAQLTTLRFVKFRFRPDASISDGEIQTAYQRLGQNPPPLDANEKAKLSELLLEQRTDEALEGWLAETRKQVNVKYMDASLR